MLIILQSNNPIMLTVDLVLFCVLRCLMLYRLPLFQFYRFLFCIVYIRGFLIILCYISSFIPGKSYRFNNIFDIGLLFLIFISLQISFKRYSLYNTLLENNYSLYFTYYILFLILVIIIVLIMLSTFITSILHPIRLL